MYMPTYKSEAGSNVMQSVHVVTHYSYCNYLFIMFTCVRGVCDFLCVYVQHTKEVFFYYLYIHLGISLWQFLCIDPSSLCILEAL